VYVSKLRFKHMAINLQNRTETILINCRATAHFQDTAKILLHHLNEETLFVKGIPCSIQV